MSETEAQCPHCKSTNADWVGYSTGTKKKCRNAFHCPSPETHGNPFRYCQWCEWTEEPPPPVASFTEAQLREAMKDHRPGNEGYCLCAWGVGANPSQEFTVEHLTDVLRTKVTGDE